MFWSFQRSGALFRSSGLAGCFAASLFGVLWAVIATPHGFIAGTASYWHTQVEDIAQYYSGYLAYLHAPWSFPLLYIPSLNWPTGTTVTFVDAIPVLSVAAKLLAPIVPLPENPFGFWVLVCFTLQGTGAWFAVSQLESNDWWKLGLAVVVCVLMPSLTARMGHLSLQAHFILLFALGLYARTQRDKQSHIVAWTTLLVLAFYINFYLTAMAIGLLFACQLDLFHKVRAQGVLVRSFIPLVAIVLTIPFMLGTAFGDAVPDPGFGYYSMNLLAPIGQGSLIALPFYVDATGGQYRRI